MDLYSHGMAAEWEVDRGGAMGTFKFAVTVHLRLGKFEIRNSFRDRATLNENQKNKGLIIKITSIITQLAINREITGLIYGNRRLLG